MPFTDGQTSVDSDGEPGPTNHHRLIVLDPRQATHVAIERTRGVALPSVDTDDRHTAEVDHVTDAVLQRYGVRPTVDAAYSTASRATESSNACTSSSCRRRGARLASGEGAASELVGDNRRALELWLATVVDSHEWTARGGTWAPAVG